MNMAVVPAKNEQGRIGKVLTLLKETPVEKIIVVVNGSSDNTMKEVVEYISKKQPKSIKTCVMLDKPSRREADITPDYVGFTIPDVFIVGYGLNYGDYYRNVPYIFTFDDK